LSANITLVD